MIKGIKFFFDISPKWLKYRSARIYLKLTQNMLSQKKWSFSKETSKESIKKFQRKTYTQGNKKISI